MGLTKMLGKSIKKKPRVMVCDATFDNWESKPAEDVDGFTKAMIEQIKAEHPLYRYVRSSFEYTNDGHIRFWFRFELKEFKCALSATR